MALEGTVIDTLLGGVFGGHRSALGEDGGREDQQHSRAGHLLCTGRAESQDYKGRATLAS